MASVFVWVVGPSELKSGKCDWCRRLKKLGNVSLLMLVDGGRSQDGGQWEAEVDRNWTNRAAGERRRLNSTLWWRQWITLFPAFDLETSAMSVLSQFCLASKWKSVDSLVPAALVYNLSRSVLHVVCVVFIWVDLLIFVNLFIFTATVSSPVRMTKVIHWNSTRSVLNFNLCVCVCWIE